MNLTTAALVVLWHLGALHPVEQLLTVLLAFGPFVLLGVVIAVRRRQDARDDAGDVDPADRPADDPEQPPVTPGRQTSG